MVNNIIMLLRTKYYIQKGNECFFELALMWIVILVYVNKYSGN